MSTEQGKTQQIHFNFDKSFQEKIVQAMIVDRSWAAQFTEVLDIEYFEHGYLKLIAQKYVNYFMTFKEFPSEELLRTMLIEDLKADKDSLHKMQVQQFLIKVAKNEALGDLPYVKTKALDFCRKQGLQIALEKSVQLIVNDDYDKVASVIKEALAAGTATTKGLELNEDIDARYSETYRRTIPTGIFELDQKKILNGGLAGGELGVVVAPTGVGKTHWLVAMGANAVRNGKNVLHYSFELRERVVGIRYDSNMMDISSSDLSNYLPEIKEHYNSHKEYGKLYVKEYPTSTVTCYQIRNHIDRLATTGFRPDMIIIDYAGIMRSSEKYEAPRFELKRVFEELRALALELDIPIWTATQSNKEGANADIVDLTNMAEAYAQAHICDFVVGISRKSSMKSTGYGTLFIAKNRAGMDGLQMKIHLDTSKSKVRILTEAEAAEFLPGEDDKPNNTQGNAVANLRRLYQQQREASPVKLERLI